MSIREIIIKYEKELENISDTPRLDVELILQKVLDVDRLYLHLNFNKELQQNELNEFIKLINQRLNNRPVAYIVENREFMGLDFFVKEGVLIPRCDTEVLVEEIIKICESNYFKTKNIDNNEINKDSINEKIKQNNYQIDKEDIKILDIGTGSGAISVSLAKYVKNSKVTSFDIEDIPLEVAPINAKNNDVEVTFIKSDLFEAIKDKEIKFDIIVSNPPYIPHSDLETLHSQVKDYEPHSALFANKNGLYFYEEISKQSLNYLNDGGILAYEVGYNQSDEVVDIMKKNNFKKIYKIKDIQGIDRVVIGYKL